MKFHIQMECFGVPGRSMVGWALAHPKRSLSQQLRLIPPMSPIPGRRPHHHHHHHPWRSSSPRPSPSSLPPPLHGPQVSPPPPPMYPTPVSSTDAHPRSPASCSNPICWSGWLGSVLGMGLQSPEASRLWRRGFCYDAGVSVEPRCL